MKRTSAGPGSFLFTLEAGPGFPDPLPGQFVNVAADAGLTLRRPFSVAGGRGGGTIELLVELRGRGTRALALLPEGSVFGVMGPLGTGFGLPENGETAVLVAGGIGVAGLRLLAERLVRKATPTLTLVGARTEEKLLAGLLPPGTGTEPSRVEVATDDGSAGFRGTVTGLLSTRVRELGGPARIYCCGPPGMIRETARIAADHGLRCEALLEEIMACGVGACRGCAVETRDGYRAVCSDGPVFDTADLVFDGESDA